MEGVAFEGSERKFGTSGDFFWGAAEHVRVGARCVLGWSGQGDKRECIGSRFILAMSKFAELTAEPVTNCR